MDDKKDSATPAVAVNPNDLLTLKERVERFNEELRALLEKYELALTAEARVQNGQVLADPKVIDQRELLKAVDDKKESEAVV